jgi:hypothetical protein
MTKEIYMQKLQESLEARAEGDEETEDRLLDELDKIWYALSGDDLKAVKLEVHRLVHGG